MRACTFPCLAAACQQVGLLPKALARSATSASLQQQAAACLSKQQFFQAGCYMRSPRWAVGKSCTRQLCGTRCRKAETRAIGLGGGPWAKGPQENDFRQAQKSRHGQLYTFKADWVTKTLHTQGGCGDTCSQMQVCVQLSL